MTEYFSIQGAERKWRLLEEEAPAGAEAAFTAYGIPLALVTSFRYLGRFLLEDEDNWPSLVRYLYKAQRKWVRLTRIFIREGADTWTLGQIYFAVVQSVLF